MHEQKKMSGLQIMRRLFKMVKPVAGYMVLCISGGILGQLAIMGTIICGICIICSIAGADVVLPVKTWTILLFVCCLLRGPSRYLEQYFGHHVAYKLLAIMRVELFEKFRRLSPAKLMDKRIGDLISTAVSDVESIELFFAHTIAPIAIAIFITILALTVSFIMWPVAGMVLLPFYIIIGIVIPINSGRIGRDTGRQYRTLLGELKSYLIDSLRGIKEILILRNGEKRAVEIDKRGENINKTLHKLIRHKNIVMALPDLFISLARIAIMAISSYGMLSGQLNICQTAIFMLVITMSFTPVSAISSLSAGLLQTFASAERIFALEDEEPLVNDPENPVTLDKNAGDITFENVSFSYPAREHAVLQNFSMDVKEGEKVALLGESGCGKSTALRLLLRFWDTDSGSIKIGGTDVRDIALKDCRGMISMLTQDTWLMDDTIEENIRLGKADATHEEVVESAKRACIHNFIEKLPEGYNSRVGELGGRLSGGERQRIGIARVLLRKTPITLLDEPTSSLDSLNEKGILKTINEEFCDRTIITVSHRPSTVAGCDRVFRLDNA